MFRFLSWEMERRKAEQKSNLTYEITGARAEFKTAPFFRFSALGYGSLR